MNIKYELINKKFDYNKLKKIIKEVDYDLPVPISKKTDIDEFLSKIKNKGHVYIATLNEEVIGCLFFYANNIDEKIAFLTLLMVRQEYRNKGIATKLINKFVEYCRAKQFIKIQLFTHETNEAAKALYKKIGFYEIDCERKNDVKLELKINNMNILITSVGRRSYLVKYFKKALNGRGKVHVANSTDVTPAFKVSDKSVIAPLIYDKNYIPFLLDYCKKNNIKLIISLFDVDLYILSKNKKKFEEIGTKLIISDENFVKICNDKWLTYNYLKEKGFNVPKTYINKPEKIDENKIKFPVIIKPRWGMGSLSIYTAENKEELKVLYNKVKKEIQKSYIKYESKQDIENSVLIQELIDGEEYGLDIINDLQGNYITTIIKKKYAMRSGETDCAKIVENSTIRKVAEKLGNMTNHIANLDVDVFLDKDKVYILEMNARFGGGYPFSHLSGVNLPQMIVNWANGQTTDMSLLTPKNSTVIHKDISIVKIK